nr:hypothetical protein [Tanacetum cinerariifolium]
QKCDDVSRDSDFEFSSMLDAVLSIKGVICLTSGIRATGIVVSEASSTRFVEEKIVFLRAVLNKEEEGVFEVGIAPELESELRTGVYELSVFSDASEHLLPVDWFAQLWPSTTPFSMGEQAHVPQACGENMLPHLHSHSDVFRHYSNFRVENARPWCREPSKVSGHHSRSPAGRHRRRRKTFPASVFGEPQERSPSSDILDPPHHSPQRAAYHHHFRISLPPATHHHLRTNIITAAATTTTREGAWDEITTQKGSGCPVFLEGTPARGTYSLQPGVLGEDTCEGYIFISARVLLEETPMMGAHGFHYCPSVLGRDTYDG